MVESPHVRKKRQTFGNGIKQHLWGRGENNIHVGLFVVSRVVSVLQLPCNLSYPQIQCTNTVNKHFIANQWILLFILTFHFLKTLFYTWNAFQNFAYNQKNNAHQIPSFANIKAQTIALFLRTERKNIFDYLVLLSPTS